MNLRALLLALATLPALASAQRRPTAPPAPAVNPAYDPTLYSSPAATSHRFKALRWRLVGPYRRSTKKVIRVDAIILHQPFNIGLRTTGLLQAKTPHNFSIR